MRAGYTPVVAGAASTIVDIDLSTDKDVISDVLGKITTSPTTATEIGYASGVTSNIQTQLDSK